MKNIQKLAATLAVSMLVSVSVYSAPAKLDTRGFIMGNDYLRMSKLEQLTYVEGVLDGINLASFIDSDGLLLATLNACTKGMPAGQVLAIVNKYVNANPTQWDAQMSGITYVAMKDGCQQRGYHLP